MIPFKKLWLLLWALTFLGLLLHLTQAQPLLPKHIALNPARVQSASATGERILAEKRTASDETSPRKATALEPITGKSKVSEQRFRKPNTSTKLGKRLMPHLKGYEESPFFKYYLHKNISRVFKHSIQDVIQKAAELGKRSKKPRERWDHPGFKWMTIFDTSKGSVALYSNLTYVDMLGIFKRVEEYEEGREKDDKIWFHRNFDHMFTMATPLGELFLPLNTTYGRKKLIHQSVDRMARFQGESPMMDGWFDSGDRPGGLFWRDSNRVPKRGRLGG